MTRTIIVVEFEFPSVGKQQSPRIFYGKGLSATSAADDIIRAIKKGAATPEAVCDLLSEIGYCDEAHADFQAPCTLAYAMARIDEVVNVFPHCGGLVVRRMMQVYPESKRVELTKLSADCPLHTEDSRSPFAQERSR